MRGEPAAIEGTGERWRFVLGCAAACLLAPPRRPAGRRLLFIVSTAAAACAALIGYGLWRYPGLRTGPATWVAVIAVLGVLAGYVIVAAVVGRDLRAQDPALGVGFAGGLVVSCLCLLVGVLASLAPRQHLDKWLLLAVPVVCVAIGVTAARRATDERGGRRGVMTASTIAGLLLFLSWVGITLSTAGRPYDSGMVRDFASSRAPDVATYAVSDSLGAAMTLLITVPLVTTALGLLGVAITRHRAARA